MGQQNRKLYNACSKALSICEAAAKFPEENQEQQRIEAAKQAAINWHSDNTYKENNNSAIETNLHQDDFDGTFTFADGTNVKAPFRPNQQQEDDLNFGLMYFCSKINIY